MQITQKTNKRHISRSQSLHQIPVSSHLHENISTYLMERPQIKALHVGLEGKYLLRIITSSNFLVCDPKCVARFWHHGYMKGMQGQVCHSTLLLICIWSMNVCFHLCMVHHYNPNLAYTQWWGGAVLTATAWLWEESPSPAQSMHCSNIQVVPFASCQEWVP